MKKHPTEQQLKAWCLCNEKEITVERFKELTGEDFYQFGKEHRKACIEQWRQIISLHKTPKKISDSNIGQPCQYTKLGLEYLQKKQRRGIYLGKARKYGVLNVRWDGLTSTYRYHPSFIEII